MKLQADAPWFKANLTTHPNGINVQCRDAPSACSTSAEKRKILLRAGQGTRIGLEQRDQVDSFPTLVAGPEDTWIARGCSADATQVSFRTFKDDVKREDYEKANPELKATVSPCLAILSMGAEL